MSAVCESRQRTSHLVRAKTLSDSVDLPFPSSRRPVGVPPACHGCILSCALPFGLSGSSKALPNTAGISQAPEDCAAISCTQSLGVTREQSIAHNACTLSHPLSVFLDQAGRRARAPPCNLPSGLRPVRLSYFDSRERKRTVHPASAVRHQHPHSVSFILSQGPGASPRVERGCVT